LFIAPWHKLKKSSIQREKAVAKSPTLRKLKRHFKKFFSLQKGCEIFEIFHTLEIVTLPELQMSISLQNDHTLWQGKRAQEEKITSSVRQMTCYGLGCSTKEN